MNYLLAYLLDSVSGDDDVYATILDTAAAAAADDDDDDAVERLVASDAFTSLPLIQLCTVTQLLLLLLLLLFYPHTWYIHCVAHKNTPKYFCA